MNSNENQETEAVVETVTEAEVETETEAEVETETEAVVETETEAVVETETEAEVETVTEAEVETVTEAVTVKETTTGSGKGSDMSALLPIILFIVIIIGVGAVVCSILVSKKKKSGMKNMSDDMYNAPINMNNMPNGNGVYNVPINMNNAPNGMYNTPSNMNNIPNGNGVYNAPNNMYNIPNGNGAYNTPINMYNTNYPSNVPTVNYIIGVEGTYAGQKIQIDRGVFFGKNADVCNIVFPEECMNIADIHCKVYEKDGEIWVRDLNSAYGVDIEGVAHISKGQEIVLKPNQKFTIGMGNSFVVSQM